MFYIPQSLTDTMTLDDVVERWQQNPDITGIVVAGSGGRGTLKPESDYDIVLVLRDFLHPLHVMLTTIDGRMTDVIFVKQETIDSMLTMTDGIKANTAEGAVLAWVKDGAIRHDPTGKLAQLKTMQSITLPHSKKELYSIWLRTNFNLYHTKRMLTSDDPIYLMACDIRLLYMLSDVWVWFLEAHGQAWRGEKQSIRYMQAHHPDALAIHQQAIREPDRQRKFVLFEQFCALMLKPIGGLWADEKVTAFTLEDDLQWADHKTLTDYWGNLLQESD